MLRAIKGSDSAVWAEGAGVGGRNWVDFWGENNWEDNTGHTNHKWLVLEGAWDGNPQGARYSLEDEIDDLLCQGPNPVWKIDIRKISLEMVVSIAILLQEVIKCQCQCQSVNQINS